MTGSENDRTQKLAASPEGGRDPNVRAAAGATDPLGPLSQSGISGDRRRAFDVAAIGMGVIATDGTWLSVNPALSALVGRTQSELLATSLEGITHPDDLAADRQALRRLIDGVDEACEHEKRVIHGSGREVWILQRLTVSRDHRDRAIHFIWQGQDISEQRRIRKAWGDAEERLRLVVAHAPLVLCAIEKDGTLTLAEGRGLAAAGIDAGSGVGRSAFDLARGIRVVDSTGKVTTLERLLRWTLGGVSCAGLIELGQGVYEAKLLPVGGAGGEVFGVIGVATDVTDRVRAEATARKAEASFRALIERALEMIVVHREGRLIYVNPAAAEALGYEGADEELLGRALADIAHPDDVAILASAFGSAEGEGARARFQEVRLRCRDARLLTVEAAGVLVVFGDEPAIVTIARDVTDRKQLQAQLLQTDRLVALGALSGGVAHEINNPLTYVLGNLDLVARTLRARAEEYRRAGMVVGSEAAASLEGLAQAIDVAHDGSERVRRIVRDLTTFARIESEERTLLDVRAVLAPVVNLVGNEIRHRARFVKDLREVPLVDANEGRLGQVFLNLLINAAHATPEGDVERNEISVTTYTDGERRAVVEVRDTGVGIAPEILNRIFEPFFTTKPVGAGSGLGLSICHGAVAALGGQITVHSAPGTGSLFRVAIPPALPRRATRPLSAPPITSPAARASVLVIDDEPLVGSIMKRLLSQHDVRSVTRAREALELIRAGERFDVILCDLMMPQMSGMDFGDELQRSHPDLAARTVFMTAGAFTARAREFVERAGTRWVDKPIEIDGLNRLIDEVLENRPRISSR